MKSRPPLTKVELIQRSMRCFTFGLIGLLPVLGIPWAALALWNNGVVVSRKGLQWNPARRYLLWGVVCGVVGLLLSVAVAFLVGLAFINAYMHT